MKAMIIVNNGLEECEALITYDLLYRAGIETDLVGFTKEIISSHNVTFNSHKLLDEIDSKAYDCLILPGGMPGTTHLKQDKRVSDIIDEFVIDNKLIAAICAAPSILIEKGLLNNDKFICFPGFECGLTPAKGKVFQDNKIITGKGLGASFEFSRLIIKNLINEETADSVLNKIQY